MRQLARSYLQHGRRHSFQGSDPIPGLGPAAVAHLQFSGTISLAPSDDPDVPWTSFATTDGTIFGTNTLGAYAGATNTSGDITLLLLAPGLYIATANATWDAGTFPSASFIDVILSDADLTERVGFTNNEALTTNLFASGVTADIYPFSIQAAFVDPGDQGALRMVVWNKDSSSHTVTDANMSCFYWPSGNQSLTSVY